MSATRGNDDTRAEAQATLAVARRTLVGGGDQCIAAGHEDGAVEAYRVAGARTKLITWGDKCLAEGDLSYAFVAYRAAGSSDKLVEVGDRCAATGDRIGMDSALRAFDAAGAVEK